jgi:hypothetical protein
MWLMFFMTGFNIVAAALFQKSRAYVEIKMVYIGTWILPFTVNQRMTILVSTHSSQMPPTSSTLNQTFGGEDNISVTFSGNMRMVLKNLFGLTSTSTLGTPHGAVDVVKGLIVLLHVNTT